MDLCDHIYAFVCLKQGESIDPTGSVKPDIEGERQTLQIYRNIITAHPDWTIEQVDEALTEEIFEPKKRNRIKSAFYWAQHAIERLIDRQPSHVFTPLEKKQIKNRLRKTQLQIPPPASVYAQEPDLFTKNEAYYERTLDGQLRLRIGGAYVMIAKSWFNLINTLGHELAHSIDPCEMRADHHSYPAYDRLIACFLRNGLIATRKNRSECGENDQLSETFADWVAIQIIADALNHFATEFHGPQIAHAARNSVRDLCDQDVPLSESELEFHPSPEIRIEKIFGRNPAIRQFLGCEPVTDGNSYCTFESDEEKNK